MSSGDPAPRPITRVEETAARLEAYDSETTFEAAIARQAERRSRPSPSRLTELARELDEVTNGDAA